MNTSADASPSESDPLLLSAARVARLLAISERTLWRLRSAGKLPRPVRIGGSLRWRAEEVRRWIDAGCPPLREWEAVENGDRKSR